MNDETNPRISQAANAWRENQPVKHQLDMIDAREALFWEMAAFVTAVAAADVMTDELYGAAVSLDQKLQSL